MNVRHMWKRVLPVLVVLSPLLAAAQDDRALGPLDVANTLMGQCEIAMRERQVGHFSVQGAMCIQAVDQVISTVEVMEAMNPKIPKPFCLPTSGFSTDQAIRIFLKFGNDHPEMLNIPSSMLVIVALHIAFPCP